MAQAGVFRTGNMVHTDSDGRNIMIEEAAFGDEMMGEAGRIKEVLTRVELEIACCSEKILNLEMLLIHVSSRASDFEVFGLEKEAMSIGFLEKTFEFDILLGILVYEVEELEHLMQSIGNEVKDTREKINEAKDIGFCLDDVEEKRKDAEESLKRSFDQILEIKTQAFKCESVLSFGDDHSKVEYPEKFSFSEGKWPLQTLEQQKQTLQMLEKSLARELDLEKKLSDSRYSEEKIKLKLHYAAQEIYFLEEAIENILQRYFEAENAAEVFMGIAKELAGNLQKIQFSLNGSIGRERELRIKFEQNTLKLSEQERSIAMLKSANIDIQALSQQVDILKLRLQEAEDKCIASNSDASILKKQVKVLEDQLAESSSLLQQAKVSAEASQEQTNALNSELVDMENAIVELKKNVAKAESRAENAEARCALLTETNLDLNQELGNLKSNENQKAYDLVEKLKESDAQLEHAKASYEAIEEQHVILYSALADMESIMEELKLKLSRAEKRAENAESRCKLLTETNLELNEELGTLRDKLEYLETSLHQADHIKVITAKDIGIKTKVITDLVVKLALERERLQIQIMTLKKENTFLAKKCSAIKETCESNVRNGEKESVSKALDDAVMDASSTHSLKVEGTNAEVHVFEIIGEPTVSTEDKTEVESEPPPMRSIEAGQLNSKHVVAAVFFLVLAILGMWIYQSG